MQGCMDRPPSAAEQLQVQVQVQAQALAAGGSEHCFEPGCGPWNQANISGSQPCAAPDEQEWAELERRQ